MHDPKNIHLEVHEFRIRLAHEHIKQRAVLKRLKLVAVRVVKKFQPVLGEHFTSVIKHGGGSAGGFFIEHACVRNPRAASVFEAEDFGLTHHALRIVAKTLEGKMPADGVQSARREIGPEFLGRTIISACEFNTVHAEIFHEI